MNRENKPGLQLCSTEQGSLGLEGHHIQHAIGRIVVSLANHTSASATKDISAPKKQCPKIYSEQSKPHISLRHKGHFCSKETMSKNLF